MCGAACVVVAARIAEEDQRHQAGAEQHGQSDAERGGDDQAGVDLAVAARDQHDGDRRDDDRQQREQPEDPPEALHHRMARAGERDRVGASASLWPREVGLSSRRAASHGKDGHDHRSSASGQGQRGRDDRRRQRRVRRGRSARREAHRRPAGGRGRADRRHHLRARRDLLPARPRRRRARLAGVAGDELAGDHRRSAKPTCWRRWR